MRAVLRILLAAAGLFLPLLLGAIPPTTRAAAPDVQVGVSVDLPTVDPQDVLTYTISMNNRGPGAAASLWLNDTMPTGTSYVDDTASTDIGAPVFVGRSFAGNTVRFQFGGCTVADRSFSLRVRVGFAVPDRQVLQNVARLWYTNRTGGAQPIQTASVSSTVAIPIISVTKTGAFTAPDAIRYTIVVANSGTASARNLWWNDTLPAGVQYRQIPALNGATCTHSGPLVNCTMLASFAPGSRTWNLDVTMPTPLPTGRVITNWVFVNYTDGDRTYLGEVRASAPVTIATASVQVFKLADAVRVAPGGTIGYTIFYNNTGPSSARRVWINDTLPQALSLPAVENVTATPAPSVRNEFSVSWQFTDVAPGGHSVSLVARALPSLGDGTVLTNSVTLDYTETNGIPMPGSRGTAVTTVSLNVPAIIAEIVSNRATVAPGGTIGYTLYYNNTRPALAASVVVDLILPPGVPLVSANPGNPAVYQGKFVWNLTNVRTGVNAISLVVAVPTDVPLGTVLRTTAFANYTDGLGNPVGGSQTSTEVTVSLFAPAAGPPFTAIGGGLIVVVIVGLLASRMYLSHTGQAVIDEVFLLHRDGLLIKHYTRRLNPDVDSDILSGMLIAVQNFVNESFIGEAGPKREGQLDELKFGEYRMLIVRGEHVITAAVVSGRRVERVPAQIRGAIEDVEKELGGVLAKWDGNMDQVAAADRYMQDLIEGRYRSSLKFGRGKR